MLKTKTNNTMFSNLRIGLMGVNLYGRSAKSVIICFCKWSEE